MRWRAGVGWLLAGCGDRAPAGSALDVGHALQPDLPAEDVVSPPWGAIRGWRRPWGADAPSAGSLRCRLAVGPEPGVPLADGSAVRLELGASGFFQYALEVWCERELDAPLRGDVPIDRLFSRVSLDLWSGSERVTSERLNIAFSSVGGGFGDGTSWYAFHPACPAGPGSLTFRIEDAHTDASWAAQFEVDIEVTTGGDGMEASLDRRCGDAWRGLGGADSGAHGSGS